MKSTEHVYLVRLDHLRCLAIVLVLLWHTIHLSVDLPFAYVPSVFIFSLFDEGHTGVSLFLVLSGFIFTALCYDKRILYGPFILTRLLRVGPLLTIWTLYYFYVRNLPPERLLASILGLLNTQGSFPGIGWTVLIEFQLYLLFPFLLVFVRNRGPKYLVGLLATILSIRGLLFLLHGNVQHLSYSTVFGRIDQFLFGMLSYLLYRENPKWLEHPLVFSAAVLSWMGIFHWFNSLGGLYHMRLPSIWIYFPALEGLFYGVITASYLRLTIRIPRPLDKTMAWVGTISYSLYLNHPIVFDTVFAWANKLAVPLNTKNVLIAAFGIGMPTVVVLSALTYYFVELPFLSLRRRYLVADESG